MPRKLQGSLLVVDDDETNRKILSVRLEAEGHKVSVAGNGRQAVEILQRGPFDLVLLDILMPEMDGYQVLKHLKSHQTLRDVPVIVLSALDEIESAVKCIEMGAEDYLTKPFNPVLLRARIGACLEKKRLRDQEVSYLQDVARVTTAAAAKNLTLKVTIPPDLPPGTGDQRRIAQVLMNLVVNAIKFAESGEVRLEVGSADGSFLVSVSDTGPGIAPADQKRIFEEFQQVDGSNSRSKGGTGLGLAIAKRIIEMHGGDIWLESKIGMGSTFTFTLPLRVERQAEAP